IEVVPTSDDDAEEFDTGPDVLVAGQDLPPATVGAPVRLPLVVHVPGTARRIRGLVFRLPRRPAICRRDPRLLLSQSRVLALADHCRRTRGRGVDSLANTRPERHDG